MFRSKAKSQDAGEDDEDDSEYEDEGEKAEDDSEGSSEEDGNEKTGGANQEFEKHVPPNSKYLKALLRLSIEIEVSTVYDGPGVAAKFFVHGNKLNIIVHVIQSINIFNILEGTACIAYVGVAYIGIGHPDLPGLDSTYSMQCGKNVVINGQARNSDPKTMYGRGWAVRI